MIFLTNFVNQQFKNDESAAQNVTPIIVSKSVIVTPYRSSVPNSIFGIARLVSVLYRKVQDGISMFKFAQVEAVTS